MSEYLAYDPPSPEEIESRKASRERREALNQTQHTVAQVLELAEQNPEYKVLLIKSLIMAIAGYGHPESREQIIQWSDENHAYDSEGDVDTIATLDQRVQEEGINVLHEFDNVTLSANELMDKAATIGYIFRSGDATQRQLHDAVIRRDWFAHIGTILLKKSQADSEI